MKALIRRKLAVRTALVILTVVAGLGTVVIAFAIFTIYTEEKEAQSRQLEELLSTVINTTRVAVFLQDGELSREITEGLIGNRAVAGVVIRTGDTVLSRAGDADPGKNSTRFYNRPESLTWPVTSPFLPQEEVGEITLISNPAALAEDIRDSTTYTVLVQLAELFVLGLCVIVVVMKLITRPITRISNRLHQLNISLGEKVLLPSGQYRGDEIGQLVQDVNSMIDRVVDLLTTEKALRAKIEIDERKFRSIFENAASAISVIDSSGRPLSWNTAFERLFSVSGRQIENTPDMTIFDLVRDQAESVGELVSEVQSSGSSRELEILIDTGNPMWLKMVLSPVEDDRIQIVANEITAFKEEVTEAKRKSALDPLTGLGNRLGVEQHLARLLDPGINHSQNALTLCFLDLDKFKEVNDIYGHQAGDQVLRRVADVIRQLIRKNDFAARIGGDEFVIILTDAEEDTISTRLAPDLLKEIRQPIPIDEKTAVEVGVSIGIAYGRPGQGSPDEFLEQADSAMYRAKEEGRNRYCFFEPAERVG